MQADWMSYFIAVHWLTAVCKQLSVSTHMTTTALVLLCLINRFLAETQVHRQHWYQVSFQVQFHLAQIQIFFKRNRTDDQRWVQVVYKSTAFNMSKQTSPWQQKTLRQQLEAEWRSNSIWYSHQLLSSKIKRQLSWNQKDRPCSYIILKKNFLLRFTLRFSKYSNVQLSSQPKSFDTRP